MISCLDIETFDVRLPTMVSAHGANMNLVHGQFARRPKCKGQIPKMRMRRRIAVIFVLLTLHHPTPTAASKFEVRWKDGLFTLPSQSNLVFGFSQSGQVDIELSMKATEQSSSESAKPPNLAYSVCLVSDAFIRDISYQRRQRRIDKMPKDLKTPTCEIPKGESLICFNYKIPTTLTQKTTITHPLSKVSKRLQLPNLYIFTIANCVETKSNNESATTDESSNIDDSATASAFELQANVSLTNPSTRYIHLGFEEALFPVLGIVAMSILLPIVLVLLLIIIFTLVRGLRVPFAVLILLAATTAKALLALIIYLYFSGVASSGTRPSWFLYTRLILSFTGDTLFVFTLVAFASGFAILPAQWAPDDLIPVMLAYIAITLQIVIFVSVKVMFPFHFFLAVTYAMVATIIAVIMALCSQRNYLFLGRYGVLIERAHIHVHTTPIARLRMFYCLIIPMTLVVYATKIIALIIFDHRTSRPDLLWGSMEISDACLLILPAVFVIPSKRSSLYANMANVSNDRLQQADAWRTAQARSPRSPSRASTESRILSVASGDPSAQATDAQSTAATHANSNDAATNPISDGESGTIAQPVSSDPQPNWIHWSSGVPLPRPDASTWGVRAVPATPSRRQRAEMPPVTLVLGMPMGETDAQVVLNMGVPTSGSLAKPGILTSKGVCAPAVDADERGAGHSRGRCAARWSVFRGKATGENAAPGANVTFSRLFSWMPRPSWHGARECNDVGAGGDERRMSGSSTAGTADGVLERVTSES